MNDRSPELETIIVRGKIFKRDPKAISSAEGAVYMEHTARGNCKGSYNDNV